MWVRRARLSARYDEPTMATQTSGFQPDPAAIFQAMAAFHVSMALKGAIELELFTHIADGASTASELAKRTEATEKGIRVLCDFLTVTGFLSKQDGSYSLQPNTAFFLSKHSQAYMGSAVFFITHPFQLSHFSDVAGVVRKGGTLERESVEPENPIWVEFAKTMAPVTAIAAASVARLTARPGTIKVLDIAAGPGMYGIEVAKQNPRAEIYALDWKIVLEVSLEHARAAGVGDRYHTIEGSALEVDLGKDYDLVLLPNFLHHFDHLTNVTLLKRVRNAMKPGGQVATIEFVPNDDRVSPPAPATFSMIMLTNTAGGDAYTFAELEKMFREAGFGESRRHDIPPSPQMLIVTDY
jgi:2-polyprenyl-3-methyl-5-hydroxy-6-metoxy-1,4-benzoquinol methylase